MMTACTKCGENFAPSCGHHIYCSESCKDAAKHYRAYHRKRTAAARRCVMCAALLGLRRHRFCSYACAADYNWLRYRGYPARRCSECGRLIFKRFKRLCSDACRKAARAKQAKRAIKIPKYLSTVEEAEAFRALPELERGRVRAQLTRQYEPEVVKAIRERENAKRRTMKVVYEAVVEMGLLKEILK